MKNLRQLDKASLGVMPNPIKLLRALMRPDQPFVMINLLSFKRHATGDYPHLTGQEAYEIYARSVEEVQAPLGSRLLWSGQVQHKVTDGEQPSFHAIGLLEYASPKAFLQSNFKGKSNTKARFAGLKGQWLIASSTLTEGILPGSGEEHLVLVELSGGLKRNPKAGSRWQEARQSTYQSVGAKTLWHGRCDHHILGTAKPEIEEAFVTWFPNLSSLKEVMQNTLNDPHRQRFRPYLAYTASSTDLLSGLG